MLTGAGTEAATGVQGLTTESLDLFLPVFQPPAPSLPTVSESHRGGGDSKGSLQVQSIPTTLDGFNSEPKEVKD